MNIYLAGPLCSEADETYLSALATELQNAGHASFRPETLFTDKYVQATGADAPARIFNACRSSLDHSDFVVVILDATRPDDGTSWAVGYAHARGMCIFGLRADTGPAGETPGGRINPLILESLEGLADSVPALLELLAKESDLSAVMSEVGKRGY